jgi:hypothetical protein
VGLNNQIGQGANYVPAYQTSGTPYVTSSVASGLDAGPTRIKFPYVTKVLTIQNQDDDTNLRVSFSMSGSYKVGEVVPGGQVKPASTKACQQGDNFFLLPPKGTTNTMNGASQVTLDVRCKEIYLTAHHASNTVMYSVYAGLTGISDSQFPILSASNGFKGVG